MSAGLGPLIVWLARAHRGALTPGWAVLSGAMIKAGILGMALCLPLVPGASAAERLGPVIGLVGLWTAFYGAAFGVFQANPKTVLAYSSLSQMGLIVAGLGLALCAPALAPAVLTAMTVYAVHHGLAKAALFFAVGTVERAASGTARRGALLVAGLCALSIAGAPLTGGGFAKDLLKDAAADGKAVWLGALIYGALPFSALATALLLIRFLLRLTTKPAGRGAGGYLWAPFLVAALGAQVLPWLLGEPKALTLSAAWASAWPLLLAMALGAAVVAGGRRHAAGQDRPRDLPTLPEGDLLAFIRVVPNPARLFDAETDKKEATGTTVAPSVLDPMIAAGEALARDRLGAALLFIAAALALGVAVFAG
ncbi:MAG: proton-conducting transporter membrane subunit [Alphaproteobacteria bacterium]